MKVIMVFTKNIVQDKLGYFGPTMAHSHNSGLALRIFLTFYRMKGADRYMIILLVVFFLRIKCIWGNLIFLGLFLLIHWTWLKLRQATFTIGSLNSQGMIYFMITAGYLNSQDMIRIVKQSRHDFSGKHLYDGYCMDIM